MRYRVLAVLVVCWAAYVQAAFAWDDKVAHPALTKNAVEKSGLNNYLISVLGMQDGFRALFEYPETRATVSKWIKESEIQGQTLLPNVLGALLAGSALEDEGTMRSKNHFHAPLSDPGGLNQPLLLLWGESALEWARGDFDKNKHSWKKAREYYSAALSSSSAAERDAKLAETFRALGQVMHLVQDMAVPAHARDEVV